MQKGFLQLSTPELEWLEGRLTTIDVQGGCIDQCLGCAEQAPKFGEMMSWDDFRLLSEDLLEIKAVRGLIIFDVERGIDFFNASNPAYYRVKDGDVIRTAYDVTEEFERHGPKRIIFTTNGWIPGDDVVQEAMERLALKVKENPDHPLHFTYSIKPVGKMIRGEYRRWLDEGRKGNFYAQSSYRQRVESNLNSLLGLANVLLFRGTEGQNKCSKHLKKTLAKYTGLFESFPDKDHPLIRALSSRYVVEKDWVWNHPQKTYATRKLIEKQDSLFVHGIERDPFYDYFVHLDHEGVINIRAGSPTSIGVLPLKPEFFKERSQWWKRYDIRQSETYAMMAGLQGKKLL